MPTQMVSGIYPDAFFFLHRRVSYFSPDDKKKKKKPLNKVSFSNTLKTVEKDKYSCSALNPRYTISCRWSKYSINELRKSMFHS